MLQMIESMRVVLREIECPTCGPCYGTLGAVRSWPDRDLYEENNPLGSRGEFIEIDIGAEEGSREHRVVIANHKGALVIGVYCVE